LLDTIESIIMQVLLSLVLVFLFSCPVQAQDPPPNCYLQCEDSYAQCIKGGSEQQCFDALLNCYTSCGFPGKGKNLTGPALPIYSGFDSVNDLYKFAQDNNNPSENWITVENSNAHFKSRVNSGGRGRAEIRVSGAVYDDFQAETRRYFRVKFSAPALSDGKTNQIGIFAQGIQEYQNTNLPWDPLFFLLAWPNQGVQLSIYTSGRTTGGEQHQVHTISYADPRNSGVHTVEIWAYFTTSGAGYYDVKYDYGNQMRVYSGPTLFIKDMKANFKVGTYAGYDGGYYSDVFVDELYVSSF
jgi:hypothetical protein